MATHKLLLLPGDGIGTEVMAEVKRVIDWLGQRGIALRRKKLQQIAQRGDGHDLQVKLVAHVLHRRPVHVDAALGRLLLPIERDRGT